VSDATTTPSEDTFDVVVIGSGPGGYVAAIRAAQLGLRVACVERESLGGICLNWGCIPTKALLRSAELLEQFHRAKEFGIVVEGEVKADLPAIVQRSRDVASKISKGVAFLLKKNKITHVAGTAKLGARAGAWQPHKVEVTAADGSARTLTTKHVILATGARAKSLPGVTLDGERVIEYRKAMTLPAQPKTMVVIGAGAIGVEFASFYRALGTEVTIVEYLPRLVPAADAEVSKELQRAFEKRGFQLMLSHKVAGVKNVGTHAEVLVDPRDGGPGTKLIADVVLVSVGISANTENLGLEAHGVKLDRGFIQVDAELRAGDGLWAIGDVIGRGLAHTASAEGVYVAERIAGHHAIPVDYDTIPACVYCHPEVAQVGLTEEQAKDKGVPYKVGKFPWRPLGKAMASGDSVGFVKVMWHAETGALVGAHMIGPAVTDLVAELTLAKATEVNAESLAYTIHAHPTFAEAIKEATEDALGHAIHL
jgi:dihydrolipoamide dehydrogenase